MLLTPFHPRRRKENENGSLNDFFIEHHSLILVFTAEGSKESSNYLFPKNLFLYRKIINKGFRRHEGIGFRTLPGTVTEDPNSCQEDN